MRAHVAAMRGRVPAARGRVGVRGTQVVYATRACAVDADEATALARVPHCHDIPATAACYDAGSPVCSVSAAGGDPASVLRTLDERTAAIQAGLRARSA
jgi:predicted ATP-grasp superfamily ATP-dependent carboligase